MRIGILFEYGSLNGGEHSMLANMLSDAARQVEWTAIVCDSGPLVSTLQRANIRVEQLSMQAEVPIHRDPQRFCSLLTELCQKYRLELLHANSLTMGRRLGAIAPHLTVPTTSHLRDIMSLKRRPLTALSEHRRLIAVSNATRDAYLLQGVAAERIEVIYNGIDTERFAQRPKTGFLNRELNLREDARLVATVGQICLRKGQDQFSKLVIEVGLQLKDPEFLIIGERYSTKQESIDFDRAVTQRVAEAGLSQRLHRLGSRDDMRAIYNELDLLVHCAKQEPLGRTLLEAASSGVPVVATDVGGTPEIFGKQSAYLHAADDLAGMTQSAIEVLSKPQSSLARVQQARERIESQFAIEQQTSELLACFERVISE